MMAERPSRLAGIENNDAPRTPPAQIQGTSTAGSPYTFNGSPHYASPFWDARAAAPVRRLSVPSGANPFIQQVSYPPPPYVSSYPGAGVFASPASSQHGGGSGGDMSAAAEAELRRRTWHPSSTQSSLRVAEPLQPPAFGGQEPPPRLPGIESFDKMLTQQQRPMTPPARARSPVMEADGSPRVQRALVVGGFNNYRPPTMSSHHHHHHHHHRRGNLSLDSTLQRNISGLHLRDKSDPPQTTWGQQTIAEIQSVPYQHHQHQVKYGSLVRPSSEDSSSSEGAPTPSTASLEYHPAIVHSSGYVEHHPVSEVAQQVSDMPFFFFFKY